MTTQLEKKRGGGLVSQGKALDAFESALEKYQGVSTTLDLAPAKRLFHLADAMNELDAVLVPEVMAQIMKLQGSRIGFKTDKDKNRDGSKGPGYPESTVKEVVKEAILYGAYMTGNEVNVIAGGMYATKEHFTRKVRELPGLTDLDVQIGTPIIENGIGKSRCKAKWKMNGADQSVGTDEAIPLIFSTRVYDREGGHSVASDMAIGKFTRKIYKLIYETATNTRISVPDGDASESAREVNAKIVDRATVNLDDIKPGDASAHTPVDQPIDWKKHDFSKAYAKLNILYDERGTEIDNLLFKHHAKSESLINIDKDNPDPADAEAVVKAAEEMK